MAGESGKSSSYTTYFEVWLKESTELMLFWFLVYILYLYYILCNSSQIIISFLRTFGMRSIFWSCIFFTGNGLPVFFYRQSYFLFFTFYPAIV